MPSAGDRVEQFLRVVRTHMDAIEGATLEEALGVVPAELRDEVRARFQAEVDQPIQRTRVLSGTGGPRPWFAGWNPAEGYYWRRLRAHLIDRIGRPHADVGSLDDSSDKVLSHLEDPREQGPVRFLVRGLVLGYVQSGKTANISATIAKAADLGYKLVIVLSGVDDGLRQQTQRRLSRELGLTDDPAGVGLPEHGKRWITLTSTDLKGDFEPGSVDANVLQGNERVLAVVKKNKFILEKLVDWMEGAAPAGLPVLVIDDEADQASINTGGNRAPYDPDDEDEPPPDGDDPSTINGLIRDLLTRFNLVSYVAYTATPFANVLIPPDVLDREVMEDLYPKDFIIPLPKPSTYIGAERLFGRAAFGDEGEDVEGLDVVRIIPDAQIGALVPRGRQAAGFAPRMCEALEHALLDFVLAAAAKQLRLGPGPATMLIHTSQRTALHNSLGALVRDQLATIRQRWRYDRDSIEPALRARWDDDFRRVTVALDAGLDTPFERLHEALDRLLRTPPEVLVLNVTSTDVLDYEADPELKVAVIGGNRLSRGLTLEGLLVSFYVRNALAYDTLMQMGRWFGYREGYVDLTRLWTTRGLFQRFRHLALVEEEFRDQLNVYERNRLTPRDFGPRIRTHPGMAITAARKMGSGRVVTLSFADQLRQTSRFFLHDRAWLHRNLEVARRFLGGLGPPEPDTGGRPEWVDVDWNSVVQFLEEYQSAQDPSSFDARTLASYIRAQAREHGELVQWRVAVRARGTGSVDLGTEDLGIHGLPEVSTIARSQLRNDPGSVGVITNPPSLGGARRQGDEEVGLTDEQIDRARHRVRTEELRRLGLALRQERSAQEGLLLVYPISRFSPATTDERVALFDDPERGCTVIGVAIVFPASRSAAAVTYVAGSAGRRDGESD